MLDLPIHAHGITLHLLNFSYFPQLPYMYPSSFLELIFQYLLFLHNVKLKEKSSKYYRNILIILFRFLLSSNKTASISTFLPYLLVYILAIEFFKDVTQSLTRR